MKQSSTQRLFVLLTEAYGGTGGISVFNRYFLKALCANPGLDEVFVLPRRFAPEKGLSFPQKLIYLKQAALSKWHYLSRCIRLFFSSKPYDLVVCGHINLLPFAVLFAWRWRVPLVLVVHGVEVWKPSNRYWNNHLIRKVQAVISVSDFTKEKLSRWSGLSSDCMRVIGNTIDLEAFAPGEPDFSLQSRYGLAGKKVLLTVARLASTERYKGVDEILETLASLRECDPRWVYLIVGDGEDRLRLQEKARALGIEEHVIFAGRISDEEKVAYYRLADVFAMPGWGEGFGIVYLEALACGIPVIASTEDGSREAVRNGELGALINPRDPVQLIDAILQAAQKPKGIVQEGLRYFSYPQFETRVNTVISEVL